MYKGKRKRLRKKDLNEQTSFEFGRDVHLWKYSIFIKGTRRKFFSNKSTGTLNAIGSDGDSLRLIINVSLDDKKTGEAIFTKEPFVLLPDIKGRKYYWVDEEQA